MKLYGILLAAACVAAQENYSTWSHSRVLTLNTTADTLQGGAGVGEALANFPVLVRLTAAEGAVFSQAAANGADIRFTDTTRTVRFKHQRERWDAAGTSAEFWVLLPQVAGNARTSFRMHWGKPGATDSSSGSAVFDTADGFRAVWHMNGNADEADATVNGLTATQTGTPLNAPGAAGTARLLNGTDQYFTLLNSAAGPLNFKMTDSYSFSAWVNIVAIPAVANSGMVILNKGDNQWMFELHDNAATPKYWVMETRGNNTFLNARSNAAMPPITANEGIGAWHHIAGTWRGGAVGEAIAETLYYDGARAATRAATNMNNTGRNESFNVFMGAMPNNTSAPNGSSRSRFWNGSLDELRVCRTSRSAGWIRLSYETQKPGSKALAFGPVQTVSLSPAPAIRLDGRPPTKGAEIRSLDGKLVPGQDILAPGVYLKTPR